MFINYWKIASRNFMRDRQFTILNLLGLATGIACALLIWLWIQDELRMDKYNEKDEQLYQVMQNMPGSSGVETIEYTPGLLAGALEKEMPDVAAAVSVVPASWFGSEGIISKGANRFKVKPQFVSQDFFKVFTCQVVAGDAKRIFDGVKAIAISDKLAARLFKTQNPVGQTISWVHNEFEGVYEIVAVYKTLPANATEQFDLLLNFDLFVQKRPGMLAWGNSDPHTYVLLKENSNKARLDASIRKFLTTKDKNSKSELFLRKFSDQYLYDQYSDGKLSAGRIIYLKLFAGIGFFILVLACINFMNLSTARAARRIKE
ncbi:MAG TPA: ABC transporter permease, partial [Flavisolibacter sp.]|nr:ABC transporter permease [Flavisolibacter sp.]